MINDQELYVNGMNEGNFRSVLNVLRMFGGGEARQNALIKQQVCTILSYCTSILTSESFEVGKIINTVRVAFMKLSRLDMLENYGNVSILQVFLSPERCPMNRFQYVQIGNNIYYVKFITTIVVF